MPSEPLTRRQRARLITNLHMSGAVEDFERPHDMVFSQAPSKAEIEATALAQVAVQDFDRKGAVDDVDKAFMENLAATIVDALKEGAATLRRKDIDAVVNGLATGGIRADGETRRGQCTLMSWLKGTDAGVVPVSSSAAAFKKAWARVQVYREKLVSLGCPAIINAVRLNQQQQA